MSEPKSVVAFEFIFDGKKMKELVDTNPAKIVCIVSIVEELTKDNRKVGGLNIIARGAPESGAPSKLVIYGCPKPPCEY